jgi:phage terminase large subunit-like protein
MVQNLEGMGFTVVPFGQGFKDMSPPTKELMKLTLERSSPTAAIRCSAG